MKFTGELDEGIGGNPRLLRSRLRAARSLTGTPASARNASSAGKPYLTDNPTDSANTRVTGCVPTAAIR